LLPCVATSSRCVSSSVFLTSSIGYRVEILSHVWRELCQRQHRHSLPIQDLEGRGSSLASLCRRHYLRIVRRSKAARIFSSIESQKRLSPLTIRHIHRFDDFFWSDIDACIIKERLLESKYPNLNREPFVRKSTADDKIVTTCRHSRRNEPVDTLVDESPIPHYVRWIQKRVGKTKIGAKTRGLVV
jgi:hypothetical protein